MKRKRKRWIKRGWRRKLMFKKKKRKGEAQSTARAERQFASPERRRLSSTTASRQGLPCKLPFDMQKRKRQALSLPCPLLRLNLCKRSNKKAQARSSCLSRLKNSQARWGLTTCFSSKSETKRSCGSCKLRV